MGKGVWLNTAFALGVHQSSTVSCVDRGLRILLCQGQSQHSLSS